MCPRGPRCGQYRYDVYVLYNFLHCRLRLGTLGYIFSPMGYLIQLALLNLYPNLIIFFFIYKYIEILKDKYTNLNINLY